MPVWVAQCLCPQRHAIMASAGEADDVGAATVEVLDPLRAAVREGGINPWCGICRAGSETWTYELARTRFRTLEEALPELKQNERAQALTRTVLGKY